MNFVLSNLPKKNTYKIQVQILPNGYMFKTSEEDGDYHIATVTGINEFELADNLSKLIIDVRDMGYKHAQEDIRNALGIPHKFGG